MLDFQHLDLHFWIRGGGAGGGHSGGGGGHSYGGGGGGGNDLGLIYLIIRLIGFLIESGPIGWLVGLVLIYVAFRFVNSNWLSNSREPIPVLRTPMAAPSLERVTELTPEDQADLLRKASLAFVTVQEAWTEKRVEKMRRFLTDGVFQRFNAQFTMMNALGQTNPISEVQILKTEVVRYEAEGLYEVADVLISASARDQFICEKMPVLNSPGGVESFTEFWSFVRRRDYKKKADLYQFDVCPQCSAPLDQKLVLSARCPFCGALINNGEYDWVLTEITQENEYGVVGNPVLLPGTPATPEQIRAVDPAFAHHLIEDRACNALMQTLIAVACHRPSLVSRFATPAYVKSLEPVALQTKLVYDRLYVDSAHFLGASVEGARIRAFVQIRYSAHQVDPEHIPNFGEAPEPVPHVRIVQLTREASDVVSKGSVYAYTCNHCGAPLTDLLSPTCGYCGAELSNAKFDWILEQVQDMRSFLGERNGA